MAGPHAYRNQGAVRRAGRGLLLLGTLAAPSGTAAQVPDTVMGDTLLAYREVTALRQDSLVLVLRRHGQYRVLLSQPLMSVVANPLKRGRQAFAAQVTPGQFAPYTILEVHPYSTGEYNLTVTGFATTDTVRFWLWADRGEELRSRERRDRQWGIGLLVGAGYHTGYRVQSIDPAAAKSSPDFEAGLLFGSSGILSGLIGVTHQARYSGAGNVFWVFAEPRVRAYHAKRPGLPVDVDLAFRIARGHVEVHDPSLLGIGAVVSRALNQRPGARGWRVGLSVMYARLGNVGASDDRTFLRGGLSLSWLP